MLHTPRINLFLASVLLVAGLSLHGQQAGVSAQQVMSALAGMRSDITLMLDRQKQLSLRIEGLEEEQNRKNEQIRQLEALCNALAQQNQSLETRLAELQKAFEADQRARKDELRNLSKDLTNVIKSSTTPPAPAATIPTNMSIKELKVESGDTLSSIAKAAGCTVAQIMAANPGLKSADDIRVGQVLKIPVAGRQAGCLRDLHF